MEDSQDSLVISASSSTPIDLAQIRVIARAQQLLILAILISIIALFIPKIGWIIQLLNLVFQLWCVYRLSEAMSMQGAGRWVWVLLMFIPFISLIALLILNHKATQLIRSTGYRVGLLGARIP